MRNIRGYVFTVEFRDCKPLFGRNTTQPDRKYEFFQSNNFTPFDSLEDAISGAEEFLIRIRESKGATPAELKMKIAETREETEKLRGKSSLVIIAIPGEDSLSNNDLFGPVVEGKHSAYPLPGALLSYNGYQTFKSHGTTSAFERAYYLASEINRQMQAAAKIAQLQIKFLPKYKVTKK